MTSPGDSRSPTRRRGVIVAIGVGVPILIQSGYLVETWNTGVRGDQDFTPEAFALAMTGLVAVGLLVVSLFLAIATLTMDRDQRSRFGRATDRVGIYASLGGSLILGILLATQIPRVVARVSPNDPADQPFDEYEQFHWEASADIASFLIDELREKERADQLPSSLTDLRSWMDDPEFFSILPESLELRVSSEFETTNGFHGNRWILRANVGPSERDLWIYYPNGRYPEWRGAELTRFGDWAYYNH
ncbi:MAG: hypothetical protein AAF196_12390 [Planctomycetota bacterium]